MLISDMDLTNLLKIIVPVIALNLILPTVVIVTDLLTVIKLYVGVHEVCHPKFATMLLGKLIKIFYKGSRYFWLRQQPE